MNLLRCAVFLGDSQPFFTLTFARFTNTIGFKSFVIFSYSSSPIASYGN